MVKLRDLIHNGMTDEQKADGEIGSLAHPKDKTANTEAWAEKVGAPDIVKEKLKGK
tara:strand:+ start:3379 stop:3546 length:168 start_codon:yes stop_codon:yes gene_type:complete